MSNQPPSSGEIFKPDSQSFVLNYLKKSVTHFEEIKPLTPLNSFRTEFEPKVTNLIQEAPKPILEPQKPQKTQKQIEEEKRIEIERKKREDDELIERHKREEAYRIQREEEERIQKEHRGLVNNGATCYLNALLQGIYNTEAGYNAILRGPNDRETIERIEKAGEYEPIDKNDQSVVSALQLIFLRLIYSKKQSLSTMKFCKALGIDTGKQEDANELMKKVLDKLEKASKAHDAKDNFEHTLEVYKETFEGQTGQTIRCQYCQHESLTQTPFTDLMLPVEENFFKCFATMVKKQEIDGYQCGGCKKRTIALQYTSVQSVPDLLCMTLFRFQQNGYGTSKDNKDVKFPICLDLEFVKNCNLGEIGIESSVEETTEMFKIVMMPWLYYEVEARNIKAKTEEAQYLIDNSEEFSKYLKIYYQSFTVENLFPDSADELHQIPTFENTPHNIFTLKSIVRHSGSIGGGHYQTISLSRPNIPARFEMLNFNDSRVSKLEKRALDISESTGDEKKKQPCLQNTSFS
ncbi:Ubiquitin_carboxyl-terminal hydrolase family protein [Hexamita inflata]|uniref:Ubiquitin carboxyl-terminal hydrolase n=1 Tax=Hexamita inflata TaxID=28002 RepID=A0AA86RKS3_9EUKA|nr:Ubiquitin carboxyl-terminal hydrolase family protein [Hexamita inflata]